MKTFTDQEKIDSGQRSSIADKLLSPKCICKKNRSIFPVFRWTFGIFRCTSKFQRTYIFIPLFLAETLMIFCGTQGFSGTLLGKRRSTSYLPRRTQRHTIFVRDKMNNGSIIILELCTMTKPTKVPSLYKF
jgi:hypothetical protein